jgi:hypothetical protein
MLYRYFILAALIAACLVIGAPTLRACQPAGEMQQRVYLVWDLVVPPPDVHIPRPAETEQTAKSRPTREDWLITQIEEHVQPTSWAAKGGHGTIEYFPLAGKLVINQTPDIQMEVAEYLRDLRRRENTEVALDIRVVTVPKNVAMRLEEFFPGRLGLACLRETQLGAFLATAAEDRRTTIMTMPRFTLLNRQVGDVEIKIDERKSTSMTISAQASANAIHEYNVAVSRMVHRGDKVEVGCTLRIPEGVTGLFKLMTTERPEKETNDNLHDIPWISGAHVVSGRSGEFEVFVLVRPHVFEEEDLHGGFVVPHSVAP